MEFLQLKYFCDAAETQNFSKTAKKFMVPTSAVSQSIRRLEKELGITLFERKTNRIDLNEEGLVFYQAVKQMDAILNDAKKQLSENSDEISGEVRLQIFCNRRIVCEAIQEFSHLYPKVSFALNHGVPSEDGFDLVISDDTMFPEGYARMPLLTEPIAAAFPADHPMARAEKLELKQLSNERFVTMNPNGRLYHLTHQLCSQAGFTPQIAVRCDDPFYIRKYIEMGLGIGFVPVLSWQGQFSDALVCRPLEDVTRTTYAYWDPSRYMSKTVKKFLQVLIEHCQRA